MTITDVRLRLSPARDGDKLRGFATITLDGSFVVRDIKIIEGNNGLFLAMPSRRVTGHCRKCGGKYPLGSKYCGECGRPVPPPPPPTPGERTKLHVDVAHPISSACREQIHEAVLDAYYAEAARPASDADAESA